MYVSCSLVCACLTCDQTILTGFPDTSYAQSLLCITLNTSSFESVATHSMVNHPFLYDHFMSPNLVTQLPLFNEWVNEGGKSDLLNLTSSVTSRGGVSMLSSLSWPPT